MTTRIRIKSESIWGKPNPSYFKFLDCIETKKLPKTLCILGCSGGKFVIPAAKKDFKVLAIDRNRTELYGGNVYAGNKKIHTEGLFHYLKEANIEKNVEAIDDNFIEYNNRETFSGVFTSGFIHYEGDSKYSLDCIINCIKSYVSLNGLLFLEYIHRSKYDNDPNRHFLTKDQLNSYFSGRSWKILKHTKHTYTESANTRVPKTHRITWGYLHASRILE